MPQKSFSKIDDTKVKAASIAALADRPNTSSTYGEGGLTAAQLRGRFDAFPQLVREKVDEIIEALSTSEAGMYITLPENTTGKDNLYDFVSLFNKDGRHENIADYIEMNFKDSSTPLASIINRLDATAVNHETALSYIDTDLYYVKENISLFNSRILDNKAGVNSLRTKTRFLEKRVTNLESIVDSDLITIDSSTDYIKTVPARSAPYAAITKFGGMSYKPENIIAFERYNGSISGGAWLTVSPGGSISVDNVAESTEEKVISTFSLGVGTYYLSAIQTHPYTRVYLRKNGTLLISLDGDDETYILSVDNATDEYSISIVVLAGGGFTMDRVKIMLHDFQGLRHAKPTAFKSVGANFFNIDEVVLAKNCGGDTGIPYRAVSAIIPHKYPMYIKVNNLPSNIHYEINYHSANEYSYDAFVEASGWIEDTEVHTTQLYENANYIIILFGAIDNASTITKEDIQAMQLQVSYGEFLSYTPYREPITLAIPTEVLERCDGLELGVNANNYNYVEWSEGRKKFYKRFQCVDLGTLDWAMGDIFYATISNKKVGFSNILCGKYANANTNFVNMQDKTITGNDVYSLIYIKDSAFTDVETFKSAMQGVMLIYELATPEVTDISDILPDDNLIAVEGGGTIIAVNEYEYAVPSEITYQLRSAT